MKSLTLLLPHNIYLAVFAPHLHIRALDIEVRGQLSLREQNTPPAVLALAVEGAGEVELGAVGLRVGDVPLVPHRPRSLALPILLVAQRAPKLEALELIEEVHVQLGRGHVGLLAVGAFVLAEWQPLGDAGFAEPLLTLTTLRRL